MPILVISKEPLWAEAVAEQLRQELLAECVVAPEVPPDMAATLAITREEPVAMDCPVIACAQPRLRMRDMLAQVQALLARPAETDTVALGGGLRLAPRQKLLSDISAHRHADLTDKETQLLLALINAQGGMVAKDALLKQVWGFEAVLDTHTLETHIYRLRAKLREVAGENEFIVAIDGGYRLEEI